MRVELRMLVTGMVLVMASLVSGQDRAYEMATVKAWLGDDFKDAKFVGARSGRITALRFADWEPLDLSRELLTDPALSRPVWSEDGRSILFSTRGRAFTIQAGNSGLERVQTLPGLNNIYEPSYWRDPSSGGLHIVYCDADTNAHYDPREPSPGNTWLVDLSDGKQEQLFNFPCDGGLSRDGTRLGEAFGTALIVDLPNQKAHKLFDGQACNATISPDDSYRLMHLVLPHDKFVVRNEYGRELWQISKPVGSEEWQTPRWSNHPDWCMATAKFDGGFVPVLVDMKRKRSLPLRSLGRGWWAPKLWLESGTKLSPDPPGPIDDLDLPESLASYRQKFARTACYTPMLNDLTRMQTTEASAIVDVIIEQGWKKFYAAAKMTPLDARATYFELAATYAGSRVGELAEMSLQGPQLTRELEAWKTWETLESLDDSLVEIEGTERSFTDFGFFNRNQATLVRMVPLARGLRFSYAGTAGSERAADLATSLNLPEVTTLPANRELEFEGVITRVSTVPDASEIAPYTAVLTWIEYDITRFLSTPIDESKVMVVHWGMQDREPTQAARFTLGMKHQIVCDLFSAHPELTSITRAQDGFEDFSLQEFMARSVTIMDAENPDAVAAAEAKRNAAEVRWKTGEALDNKQTYGSAWIDKAGQLDLRKGAVEITNIEELVPATQKSGRLLLEMTITPADVQRGRLFSLVDAYNRPNLVVVQDGRWLAVQLRTSVHQAPQAVPLATIEPGKPNRLRLRYADGQLVCSINEQPRVIDAVTGSLSNWRAGHLLLGNDLYNEQNWDGHVSSITFEPR